MFRSRRGSARDGRDTGLAGKALQLSDGNKVVDTKNRGTGVVNVAVTLPKYSGQTQFQHQGIDK
jgi:hypothetical protein